MPYFFYLYWSSYSSLCSIFDAISSNIDEVLSINSFYNMLVFRDFKVHHKDWLPYSGGTDRTTLTIFLSKMILLRWLSFLLGSMTVILSPVLLHLFLSSETSICFKVNFHPLGDSDQVLVSISIDFPSNSESDDRFIAKLVTILVLVRTVFVIIWEIFHRRKFLN